MDKNIVVSPISILIPLYNGSQFLEESVGSVLAQTYPYWELLIGINGHPQNSLVYQYASTFMEKNPQKIHIYDFHEIKGKVDTLNQMIQYCKYDTVAILDVDDIWHPRKLEIQIEKVGQYDVIGTQCVYMAYGRQSQRNGQSPKIPLGDISSFDFSLTNPIINSSVIFRKSLAHWRESGVEDYELWLRLRSEKRTFYNFSQVLVNHRLYDDSAFNSKPERQKEAVRVILNKKQNVHL